MQSQIAIQGFKGCFHEEAARKYFNGAPLNVVECEDFNILASRVKSDTPLGIMAIENSIAGSLLQNYRILRENGFTIIGEVYLRIVHNLMALPGQQIEEILEASSHPMAINQCLEFFKDYPSIKLVESKDTALSAKLLSEKQQKNKAAIASRTAAELYGLDIIAGGIETSKINYTRFFIIQNKLNDIDRDQVNKASIYIRVKDEPGCLLKVLEVIESQNVNISKLQSYPVLGKVSQYFFHLDLEFDHISKYEHIMNHIDDVTLEKKQLGIYKKAIVYGS